MNQTQIIQDCENQLREAMLKSDIEILDRLLHDDLLFILPSADVITKKMDLETHHSGNLKLEEINSSLDSIQFIGENAVVTLTLDLIGKSFNQSFEGKFRYLRVWKKIDEQFKVIAGSGVAL